MNILILGGSRFIGKAIAQQAAAAGHEVTLFNRGKTLAESSFAHIQGDLAELEHFKARFASLQPDVVVHCMALSEQDAQRAVQAFAGLNCQLLVLGSADCYDAFQALNRGEERAELPLDENSPLTSIRHYYAELVPERAMNHYDKNLMTAALMQAGAQGLVRPTVYRVPMVWGPEDYQFAGRHGSIIRRIYDRQRQFVLGSSSQQTIWHFGYIDNIAAAVVHSFGKDLDQQVFNLGEPKQRSWRRWIALYAQAAGFEFEVELVPDEWLDPEHKRNTPPRHNFLDTHRFRELTGFVEPVALESAIACNLEWGLAHPEQLGPAPDYAGEAQKLAAYQGFLKAQQPEPAKSETRKEG